MKDLMSLIKLVGTKKVQQVDLFNGKKSLPFKSKKLFEGVMDGKILSDEDALNYLYGQAGALRNLQKLKNRLKKRLLNTLVFISSNREELSDRKRANLELGRMVTIVSVLFDNRLYALACDCAKKGLSRSQKFEFTNYSLEFSRYLFMYYSLIRPNKKMFSKYKELNEVFVSLSKKEIRVESLYNQISFLYLTNKTSQNKELISLMSKSISELNIYQKETTSFKLNLTAYNICSSYYILIKDYYSAVKIARDALDFFAKKSFKDMNSVYLFRTNLILSAIGVYDFKLALENSTLNLKLVNANSSNWYIQRNYRFIILTGLEDYQSLYSLTLEVVNSKKYKNYALQNEYWKVIEAYIQFMIRLRVIDPSLDESGLELKPFRLNKFLNEVPKYSKDKRGLNVSILVVQFLFLLLDKKYDAIIDRADALKQYTYRYLKNDETFRSNLFLKLLIKVIEQDFHPVAVERHTQKLFARLHETKRNTDFQSNQLEIIPYEKMWEFVQQLLERNYREG